MKKQAKGKMIAFSLVSMVGLMSLTSIATAYPIRAIFESDLFGIVLSIPQIETIYVQNWYEWPDLTWAVICINYTDGLSDSEKIVIQDQVQYLLEQKWYTSYVEPNYVYHIPGQPPPWPGFAIGELIVGFMYTLTGDVTGPQGLPDNKCDIMDVSLVARIFGVARPDPRYNIMCDVVYDGKIDMQDISLVARHFGETG